MSIQVVHASGHTHTLPITLYVYRFKYEICVYNNSNNRVLFLLFQSGPLRSKNKKESINRKPVSTQEEGEGEAGETRATPKQKTGTIKRKIQ